MTPQIDLSVSCADWRTDLPDLETLVHETATAVIMLAPEDWRGRAEVHFDFLDDSSQRRLNKEFRGQDRTTNVLAFANLEGEAALMPSMTPSDMPVLLGDITLAHGKIVSEAAAQKKSLSHHTRHLIVHGVLHLLRRGHDEAEEAAQMEAEEISILAELGIADPYIAAKEESTGTSDRGDENDI